MVASDMRRARALRLALVVAVAGLAALGCRTRSGVEIASGVVIEDNNRFPHPRHTDLQCTECHALVSVLAGERAVPGADDHAPCDRGNCHQDAFLKEPGDICRVCHERAEPAQVGDSPLSAYPRRRGYRALAARFAHDKHLNFTLMERQVGFHVTCGDCHTAADTEATHPGHDVCSRCHAPEAAHGDMPALTECDKCHSPRARKPARIRRVITGDLRFRHGNHRTDVRGKPIRCIDCHSDTRSVRSITAHLDMDTGVCVACHDDPERTPSSKRMRVCQTCHSGRSSGFEVLAPRSHLPRLERPEDHTLAFRRGHGEDARQNATRCARCHTFMSGASRDVCDECHQIMQPHDHGLSWREFDHGPEASARADACATCHKGSFCGGCHSLLPRSHRPLMAFAQEGGHALAAQINIRACITCHDPTDPNQCRRCHVGGVAP